MNAKKAGRLVRLLFCAQARSAWGRYRCAYRLAGNARTARLIERERDAAAIEHEMENFTAPAQRLGYRNG